MRIEKKQGAIAALLIAVLIGIGLSASFAFGGSNTGSAAPVGLRATLSGRTQHAAGGMFVATLRGTALRWSLAYKGGRTAKMTSRIRARSARPAKLCSSCASLVRGRLRVSRVLARALTHRKARVELRLPGASTPSLVGPITVQQVPVLTISSPKPGQTYWTSIFPGVICAQVTAGPPDGHPIATTTAPSLLGGQQLSLIADGDLGNDETCPDLRHR